MTDTFNCPNCKKKFDENNPDFEAKYYYDDEDEFGNFKYDVEIKCPFCNYLFYEEVWDDFIE